MKNRIISIIAVVVLLCTLAATVSASQIKNVIFMIPDGAGMNSFDFANDLKVAGGFDDTKYPYRTQVDTSPMYMKDYMAGTCITDNYLGTLTDSAAAGTALSTGIKTLGGYLGVDYRSRPKANLLEAAQSIGMSTGLVATYEWMHATPAAFGSHVSDREDYRNIYEQMENQGIDVVLGSGYGAVEELGATIQNAIDRGYTIVTTRNDLLNVKAGDRIWGNATNPNSPFDISLSATQPTLEDMTRAAITALSGNEKGFFLMVEGSRVDTGGHSNDAVQTSSEYIAFDAAFKAAVEFAKTRTDTIVIAVPDHDTGSMKYADLKAQGGTAAAEAIALAQQGINPSTLSWGTSSHSREYVGVWTYIPDGVGSIRGLNTVLGDNEDNRNNYVIDNTAFAPYIAKLWGVDLEEVTNELFVDVTEVGVFDENENKFVFNSGDKYVYRNASSYFKDGSEISLDGKVAVYSGGRMYVPSDMVEEGDWDKITEKPEGIQGTGAKDDPFIIDDAKDIRDIANALNEGETYEGKYFLQVEDVDLSEIADFSGIPVTSVFKGVYNGDGYLININLANSVGDAGVFGTVADGGVIVNVGVTGSVSGSGMASGLILKLDGGKLVNSFSVATAAAGSGTAAGLVAICSNKGVINNCYFAGYVSSVSGSVYPIAHLATSDVSIGSCYYVKTCGGSQTEEGISFDTSNRAKKLFPGLLEKGMSSVSEVAGILPKEVLYWRSSSGDSILSGFPELYAPIPNVTSVTVSPESATVCRGQGIQLTAVVEGEYNFSTAVNWSIESTQGISDETYISDSGYLYIGNFEAATSFKVMAKSKANGAVADSAEIIIIPVLVLDSDITVSADDDAVLIDSVVIGENVTVTLEKGNYLISNVTCNGSVVASANANVIVTDDSNIPGYVEINIGKKLSSSNKRYAEVDGEQYEISEYNNLYGVITNKDMLVEITEKASEDAVVAERTSYYFVDADNGTYEKLDMDSFVQNVNDLSIRFKDPVGLRFKTKFSTAVKLEKNDFEIVEYGFVIGLESRLINNNEQLTLDADKVVSGVAYSTDEKLDVVFDSTDDDWSVVTGVLINVPESSYGENVVSKTYSKIKVGENVFTVYGEPVVANLYEVTVMELSLGDVDGEQKEVLEEIVSAGENMTPDFGFDASHLYN